MATRGDVGTGGHDQELAESRHFKCVRAAGDCKARQGFGMNFKIEVLQNSGPRGNEIL